MSRPSTFNLVVLGAFVICAIGLFLWQFRWPTATVVLKDTPLEVLVAKTPKHHFQGLGGRERLAPYDGMLFLFPFPRRIGIVMRDMNFPIDIVWLDGAEVVDFVTNVEPEPGVDEEDLTAYYPRAEVDIVLELPAGWADAHGLQIGDRLDVIDE